MKKIWPALYLGPSVLGPSSYWRPSRLHALRRVERTHLDFRCCRAPAGREKEVSTVRQEVWIAVRGVASACVPARDGDRLPAGCTDFHEIGVSGWREHDSVARVPRATASERSVAQGLRGRGSNAMFLQLPRSEEADLLAIGRPERRRCAVGARETRESGARAVTSASECVSLPESATKTNRRPSGDTANSGAGPNCVPLGGAMANCIGPSGALGGAGHSTTSVPRSASASAAAASHASRSRQRTETKRLLDAGTVTSTEGALVAISSLGLGRDLKGRWRGQGHGHAVVLFTREARPRLPRRSGIRGAAASR